MSELDDFLTQPSPATSKQNKHSVTATRDRGWLCGQPRTR
jgi:hypothetical protein